MKKAVGIFFGAFILATISCKRKNVLYACEYVICNIDKPEGTYDYPIKPGTAEWVALPNKSARYEACQIPLELINQMHTATLLQSSLDFPYFSGDLLLNYGGINIPVVLNSFMQNFSGFIELRKRTDVINVLLSRYQNMCPLCINYTAKSWFSPNFSAFELVISYPDFISKMSLNEKKGLVKEALNKYTQKKSLSDNFAMYAVSTSLYICVQIMFSENFNSFMNKYNSNNNIQNFTSMFAWPENPQDAPRLFDEIVEESNTFIKN